VRRKTGRRLSQQGSLVEAGPLHLAIVPRPLAGGDTTPVADTSSLALAMLVFGSPKRW